MQTRLFHNHQCSDTLYKVCLRLASYGDQNYGKEQGRNVLLFLLNLNLHEIDNVVKFSNEQQEPRVEIGTHQENNETIFFVRDNGIGIAPQFYQRIFGHFGKLDPMSEGTGVGLALVKRIIEVHGGRIWVESEKGKGATFCFTLPLAKNEIS